jgi:hypothetical protein
MANAADMITMSTERRMTAHGEDPRSILNARMPTVQKIAIWTRPLAAVLAKAPPRIAGRVTELASSLSSVVLALPDNHLCRKSSGEEYEHHQIARNDEVGSVLRFHLAHRLRLELDERTPGRESALSYCLPYDLIDSRLIIGIEQPSLYQQLDSSLGRHAL